MSIEIENFTGNPQPVYTKDGVRHILPGYSTRPFPDEIGKLFIAQRGNACRVAGQTTIPPLLIGQDVMWIANMTGNPFVDPTIKVMVTKREKTPTGVVTQEVEEIKPNPLAKGRTLNWTIQTGQGPDPYGRVKKISAGDDFNLPPLTVSLKAGRRVPIARTIGEWILQRDSLAGDTRVEVGKVIECREPSGFEPTPQWSVMQMLVYARMMDEMGFANKPMKEFFAHYDPAAGNRAKNFDYIAFLGFLNDEPVTDEAFRGALLNRIFYRLVDPLFALPTEAGFKRYYEEMKAEFKTK